MPDPRRWYHVIVTTYGAWLHGDPRGFRTRHHRQHVAGDYKRPPPAGAYLDLERRTRRALKEPAVTIPVRWRPVVGRALLDRLADLSCLVVALAVGGQHVHLLAKMPSGEARPLTGAAKRHAWFELRRAAQWRTRLWGQRCKALAIRSREHQLRVYRYIVRHAEEGAWVWKWGDAT